MDDLYTNEYTYLGDLQFPESHIRNSYTTDDSVIILKCEVSIGI